MQILIKTVSLVYYQYRQITRPVKNLKKPNKQLNIEKYWQILILVRFAQSNSLDICFQSKENDLDHQLGHQTSRSP